MEPLHAILLGFVEGLTEFLPVSSTGHLILASHWLGLHGQAVNTFDIVIQAGAVAAVLGLYGARVGAMGRGLLGRDSAGRRMLGNLAISFLPAALAGLALHGAIKTHLFAVWPVVAALATGGILMIAADRWLRGRPAGLSLETLPARAALLIGLAQCLSLWPGTSRAMVTMLAGMALGLPAAAAAEYSFLLALPTLGAATLFDAAKGGSALLSDVGPAAVVCGFLTAAAVAALAMRGLIAYLTRHGLAVFGWYRLALAALVLWIM